ncbi:MAG: potassium transporter TrkA, partial [Campylobacteraceae bacterium]|nr:potassium transporter TrkA [Campylobacteraceae bacterium]
MKKILIIADGILAKYFLERVITLSNDSNDYTIVYYRKKTLPNYAFPENFEVYSFDPTSFEKMMPVMNKDYYQIMIAVSKKIDAIGSYKNIRQFNKKVPIFLMDRWGFEFKDKYLTLIESREVMAYRFADFLPNTPVTAQNVGLAIGEIMDVQVPVGSSYVYRHVGGIEQTKWRIAAVYRNNALLLPKPNLMIQPNDSLLVVGAPDILQNVYKSIKRELGQFPLPFGNNIYCLIDMKNMNEARIEKLLDDALYLHTKLNSKKLYIK